MILEVPFMFTRSGKLPRERTVQTYNLVGVQPVSVPEVADRDAPMVARCRYATARFVDDGGNLAMAAAEAEADYRLVGGRIVRRAVLDGPTFLNGEFSLPYRALEALPRPLLEVAAAAARHPDGVPDVTAENAQGAMNLLARWGMMRGARSFNLSKPSYSRRNNTLCAYVEGGEPLNRVDGDNRARRAAEIRATMEGGAVFVDGVLYLPSYGPAWVADGPPRDGGPVIAEATPEMAWHHAYETARAYREQDVLEAAVAAECAAPRPPRGPCEFGGIEWRGAVEILDPAAMPLDPEEMALRSACVSITSHLGDVVMASRRPAAVRAYAGLLEAIQGFETDVPAGLEALRDFADAWQIGREPGESFTWACDAADAVLDRVAARRAAAEADGPSAAPRSGS